MGRASAAEAKQASETGAGMGDYRPGDCSHEQTLRTWMIRKASPFYGVDDIRIRYVVNKNSVMILTILMCYEELSS